MKVVCIDDKNQICDIGCEDGLLIEGETYTMIDKGQFTGILTKELENINLIEI